MFLQVCKKQPGLREDYQDAWPIEVVTSRYLTSKRFVKVPEDIAEMYNSVLPYERLRKAMKFYTEKEFNDFKVRLVLTPVTPLIRV